MSSILTKSSVKVLLACMSLGFLHADAKLPEGPGKDTFVKVCGQCHPPENVVDLRKTRSGWSDVIEDMVAKGASGSDEEIQTILDYLSKNFGRSSDAKVPINTAASKEIQQILELTAAEAEAIVHYREAHGKFGSWDDLKKVPDIDISKLAAKKDRIIF